MLNSIFHQGKTALKNFVSGRVFAGNNFGLSDLLLYAKMVDDGIILQTDGSFLAAFWFKGFDLETSTDEELTILSSQINTAFNLLSSGWLFHIDTLRYKAMDYTKEEDSFFPDATSKLIDNERRSIYQGEGNHYENSYAISFTYRPTVDLGSRLGLFFRKSNDSTSCDYAHYLSVFKNKLQEIIELLTKQINLLPMNSDGILSYISWCLTGEPIELKLPIKYGVFLKHYLSSHDLYGGENPKLGDNYIKAITLSGFPSESYPGILDKLNYLDFEYRWSTRFIFLSQYEGSKVIDKVSNLWYQKRISASDTIKLSLSIDSNIKINQNSDSQYQDAQLAKSINESGDVKFGFYTATVILIDKNYVNINYKAEQVRALFRSLGFQSQVERMHSIEAYLGTLPGYSYANVRKWPIHTLNLSDIMPSTSIWSGLSHNPCSFYPENSPPLFFAGTTGCTPLRLSLHVADNGHTLILGPTGSGKSTLLNFIIAQHLRYKNARVFVFDKNRSSLPLCHGCSGNFFDIGHSTNNIYFQPLANLESDLDFDFAANWVEELCVLNGLADKFNDSHRLAIRKALVLMQQETPQPRRTLSYFRHLVQDYDKSVAAILDNFSQEQRALYETSSSSSGLVNKIFDASDNVLSFAHFNVFEMGKLMDMGDKVIIPALRYLTHVISKQFDNAFPTLIVFDESFIFFKHPLFRERIIEWIKTVRKFNVAIVFATQEMADLMKYSDLNSALKTNCATKIFLPNRKASSAEIIDQYRAHDLNKKQIDLIAHGVCGDYFYFSDLGTRCFSLELNKNQATYAFVARTSQQDINDAIKIKANYPNEFGAAWLKHFGIDSNLVSQWNNYNLSEFNND